LSKILHKVLGVKRQFLMEHDNLLVQPILTSKGPKSQNGFFESLGRLSKLQKHERVSEILEEGRIM
jgi:hypothetical protein